MKEILRKGWTEIEQPTGNDDVSDGGRFQQSF